jgi:hypothetical protein
MTGERAHALGAEGIDRAKTWLEATMRANVPFVAPNAGQKLEFQWADGRVFSYDMKGNLISEAFDGQQFLAEVKNYSSAGDLGDHFDKFLAQAYRVISADPRKADEFDRFLWISWAPFRANTWDTLCNSASVATAVQKFQGQALPSGETVDAGVCGTVAQRVWVVVMSEAVEMLVPTDAQRWLAQSGPVIRGGGK